MTTFEYKGKTWRLAFRHTVDHRTTFRRTLFKHVTTVRYRYGTTATLAVRQEHAYVGRGDELPCELCRKAALGGLLEDLDDRDLAGAVRQAYVAALAAARAKGVSKEKEDSSHGV